MAESIARERGLELRLVDADEIAAHLTDDVAVLMLTHVNYRDGRLHDMAAINRAAHAEGVLVVWDLAHSAGAVPVDLKGGGDASAASDFAVGCGYKYLNGGPGAPAFVWANPKHTDRMDALQLRQPLSGWFGHASPFEFLPDYRPGSGMARFNCGTPPILSLAALECGVDTLLAAESLGGVAALRQKSLALTELFMDLVKTHCRDHDLVLRNTPRPAFARESGELLARGGRLRDHAGIDRAQGDRGFPCAGCPALRFRAALHALRRRMGRRSAACNRSWRAANGARLVSISAAP